MYCTLDGTKTGKICVEKGAEVANRPISGRSENLNFEKEGEAEDNVSAADPKI